MISKIIRGFNCFVLSNFKFIILYFLKFNQFKFSLINYISPGVHIDIRDKGKIAFGKKCNILNSNVIGVRNNGKISICDGVFINRNCQIIAHSSIKIKKNVCIGPNSIIMDHDHIFSKDGVEKKSFKSKSIIIEENVWIGANVVILKGVKIGRNSVISAGSVVTKDVPEKSILIQKRDNYIKKMEE